MRFHILCCTAITVAACVASSPAAEPAKKPEVVRLAITPAVEPVPALKYQLLPTFLERRPGNAALDYGRAIMRYSQYRNSHTIKFVEEWNKWLELPLDEFERAVKGRDLSSVRDAELLDEVRRGARCEHCEWQLPLRDQAFYLIALPELQELRSLARLVRINVRLNIVEGKFDAALDYLKMGYALARHAAEEPTIVSGLVGISIAGMMDEVRLDLVQRAGAPSLYWAETFLPQPLINLRPGLEAEMYAVYLTFPELRETRRSPEQWTADAQKLLRELPPLMAMAGSEATNEQSWSALLSYDSVMGKIAARRDELRAFVVRCGNPAGDVEQMNDSQLLLEFTRLKFEDLRDGMFRWFLLPYADVRSEIEAAERGLRDTKENSTELIPLGGMLLPAVASLKHMMSRADRRRDVLRIVEALRLYAGKHDGALPKTLTDVTDVPLPKVDPMTGKPYDYALDGDTARLTLSEENRSDKKMLVYEITVAK